MYSVHVIRTQLQKLNTRDNLRGICLYLFTARFSRPSVKSKTRLVLLAVGTSLAVANKPARAHIQRDNQHVSLSKEVRALWSRNGSFGLAQRCIAVQLLSYNGFIRWLMFMADKQESPWLSSLAYYVLDLGLLRAMTVSVDTYEAGDGLVGVLRETGFVTIPYYCCPTSERKESSVELDDNRNEVMMFLERQKATSEGWTMLMIDVRAFIPSRLRSLTRRVNHRNLSDAEVKEYAAAVHRLFTIAEAASACGVRLVLDVGSERNSGAHHIVDCVAELARAKDIDVLIDSPLGKHGAGEPARHLKNVGGRAAAYIVDSPQLTRLSAEAREEAWIRIFSELKPPGDKRIIAEVHTKGDIQQITDAAHQHGVQVCFTQMAGIADSVSLLLLHMGNDVAKVIPVGTIDGRVSWARRFLQERGFLLISNPDKALIPVLS